MTIFFKNTALLIAEGRKKAGLTQVDVATKVRVSFRTYQRIECGEISPRVDVLFQIFRVLNINVSEALLMAFYASGNDLDGEAQSSSRPSQIWQNQRLKIPMLISEGEVEGIKRALSEDFTKGLAKVGYWEWNVSNGQFYWSSQMFSIYEMNPELPFVPEKFKAKLTPESILKIEEDLNNLISAGIPYDNIHQVKSDSGDFQVRAFAKKYLNEKQENIVFGIAEKVTA